MRVGPVSQERANAEAVERIGAAEPVLTDISPAIDVVPGMTAATILTSGAPLAWEEYTGGQRNGIIGAALYEGLAGDAGDADAKLARGELRVEPAQAHGCIGSLAGIYSASMPVFVVDEPRAGRRA